MIKIRLIASDIGEILESNTSDYDLIKIIKLIQVFKLDGSFNNIGSYKWMNEVYLGAGERDWTELCLEAMKWNEMKVYLGAVDRDMTELPCL